MSEDNLSRDEVTYDEVTYDEAPADVNQALTGLVVLVIALLGAPQVWDALRDRDFGPELIYFPVLVVVLGHLALRGRVR